MGLGVTITVPKAETKGKVVLLSGSSATDRDATVLDHKPFLIMADRLSRAGFATARYDDRGVAESNGDYARCSLGQLASDGLAVMSDMARLDLGGPSIAIGHSLGGVVACQMAARGGIVDAVVALATPFIYGLDALAAQYKNLLILQGWRGEHLEDLVFRYRSSLSGSKLLARPIADYARSNPRDFVPNIKVPILAIFGTLDVQVDACVNAAALEEMIDPDLCSVEIVDGMNHLLQPSTSAAIDCYWTNETTLSEDVVSVIVDWLNLRCDLLDWR